MEHALTAIKTTVFMLMMAGIGGFLSVLGD